MEKQVGLFDVEEAFFITGRGWVLAGEVSGIVAVGNHLYISKDVLLQITEVEAINNKQGGKVGLLVRTQFASRQELIDLNIIGATARILE